MKYILLLFKIVLTAIYSYVSTVIPTAVYVDKVSTLKHNFLFLLNHNVTQKHFNIHYFKWVPQSFNVKSLLFFVLIMKCVQFISTLINFDK